MSDKLTVQTSDGKEFEIDFEKEARMSLEYSKQMRAFFQEADNATFPGVAKTEMLALFDRDIAKLNAYLKEQEE